MSKKDTTHKKEKTFQQLDIPSFGAPWFGPTWPRWTPSTSDPQLAPLIMDPYESLSFKTPWSWRGTTHGGQMAKHRRLMEVDRKQRISGFIQLFFQTPRLRYESYIIILACMPSVIIRYDCTWKWEHENVPVEMHLPRYKLVIYMSEKIICTFVRHSAWAHVLAWVRSAMEFQRKWIGIGWRFQNCTQLCGISV